MIPQLKLILKKREEKYASACHVRIKSFPEISLTKQDYKNVREFSEKSDYEEYKTRNPYANKEKFKSDIYYGKLGEIIVERYLSSCGITLSKPTDFHIYNKDNKSFDSDVVNKNGVQFSIKTCYNYGFPVSWTLQYSNPNKQGGQDPHFFGNDKDTRNNEYFCGVMLNPSYEKGTILWIAPMQFIYENQETLYQCPEKESLKEEDTKRMIYWDTVVKHDFHKNFLCNNF